MAIRELEKSDTSRPAIRPLLPKLSSLLLQDPYLGVRLVSAECIGGLGEQGKDALTKAALNDKETWVRDAASSALTAVKADNSVMIPMYESMIRSSNKDARKEGIAKADALYSKGIDIKVLIPALTDVFRKPMYDANFSNYTRVPAMALLKKMKVDTRELVPFIIEDIRTAWKFTSDGYHPYQKITICILGGMGADGESAIPLLEEVIADPSKFGCTQAHPDYTTFISLSKESIRKIWADLEKKGSSK